MMKVGTYAPIYTVVEVVRGVATGAHTFRHVKDAYLCAERLRRDRNLDEDDVQIFKSRIDHYEGEEKSCIMIVLPHRR